VGIYWFKETLTLSKCLGVAMIVAGVLMLHSTQDDESSEIAKDTSALSVGAAQVANYGSMKV
jgi:drug/metabolite transporter (DMT)-like permease